jgi:nicotinamidase/pyrazinamidase
MITINYEQTASFDVDAQKGFTTLCPNELPVPGGHEIVDELNATAKCSRYRIGSKDWHHPEALHLATKENPQFSPVGLRDIDIRWNRHCQAGTEGADLLDGLPHWSEYDFFVHKGMEKDTHPYGAAYHDLNDKRSTGVIEWAKAQAINTVIMVGLATDFCVKTTAIQFARAGFDVIVNLSGCRAINAPISEGVTTLTNAMQDMASHGIRFVDSHKDLKVV